MSGAYILLTEEVRRARKHYLCIHCAEPIEPGEEHVFTSGAYGGSVQGDRWHSECRKACCARFEYSDWLAWEPGAYRRGSAEIYSRSD
jgi:hypothetical protein